ncbi:MAG: nucleotide exchange factor GrpE [Thermoanaerobaculia bacterium]
MSDGDNGSAGPKPGDDAFDDTVVEILGFDEESDDREGAAGEAPASAESRRLAEELAEQKERFVRLRADFDNFRKRAERERGEIERYALVEPIRDLLPVVDNLERALAAAAQQNAGDDLRQGVEMIHRQLQDVLKRFGLTVVAARGERFDPSLHEAVSHESSAEVEAPMVIDEYQRGYRLNERLLRPALVRVAMPVEPAGRSDAAEEPAAHREPEEN